MTTSALIKLTAERWIHDERLRLKLTAATATISVWVDGEGWRTLHRLPRRDGRFASQGLSRPLRDWLLDLVELQTCISAPEEQLDELLPRKPMIRAQAPRRGREAA
jgi:hypothetical protein